MLYVLRLGHRKDRDKRISTHVLLVSRLFKVDKVYYSGEKDEKLEESLEKVNKSWGGRTEVEYVKNWKKLLKEFNGVKVHLTMYGIPFKEKIDELKSKENMMIIIGSEKVPGEVYELTDFNLAVGNQPHSEVSALAIFLYELKNRNVDFDYEGQRMKIVPQERSKKVIEEQ